MAHASDIARIAAEVENERLRQEILWGQDFDAKNTSNDWASFIIAYVGMAVYDGRQEKYTPDKFRENMKKASALCQAAMLQIDLHGDCAPRHYEGQLKAGAKE